MMSYDKLIEQPSLSFDRARVQQGGAALADWMEQHLRELEERLRDVNRYANHFRGWTHASDFDKLDGGDHYAGSIVTAGAALNAWTNPQSAYTASSTPISDVEAVIQTMSFTATGQTVILFWGGIIGAGGAPTNAKLRLYRDSELLIETMPVLTAIGYGVPVLLAYVEAPAAATVSYTLRGICTLPGGAAVVSNRVLVGLECKR